AGCPLRSPRLLPARDSSGVPGGFRALPQWHQGDRVAARELRFREPMKILTVVGTRSDLLKIAPLTAEIGRQPGFRSVLVHAGQPYRSGMSDRFFPEMAVGQPDFALGVGPGPHAAQTAEIMRRIGSVMIGVRPDRVLVVGDENSTLAAALTAVKL